MDTFRDHRTLIIVILLIVIAYLLLKPTTLADLNYPGQWNSWGPSGQLISIIIIILIIFYFYNRY